MYNEVKQFTEENNVLTENQYGFWPNHSTYMALLNLIDSIMAKIEIENSIYVYIPRSINRLWHFWSQYILLSNLHLYGLRAPAQTWLSSYLSDRWHYGKLGNLNQMKKHKLWSTLRFNTGTIAIYTVHKWLSRLSKQCQYNSICRSHQHISIQQHHACTLY